MNTYFVKMFRVHVLRWICASGLFFWHHYSMPTNAVIIRICIAACHRSIAGKRLSKLTLRHSDETRKMSTRLAMAVKIVLLLAAIPFTWTQGPG